MYSEPNWYVRSDAASRSTLTPRRLQNQAGPLAQIYELILKRNATYVIFIFTGAAIGGWAWQAAWDVVWSVSNAGREYDSIDWSKWDSQFGPDDEEDDE